MVTDNPGALMASPRSPADNGPTPPYPVACPKCHQLTGQPYDVLIAGRHIPITIYLECEACRHEWCADGPAPTALRRDRRA